MPNSGFCRQARIPDFIFAKISTGIFKGGVPPLKRG